MSYFLDLLRDRGAIHEKNYIEYLANGGLEVARIDCIGASKAPVAETLSAMKVAAPLIVQDTLLPSTIPSARTNYNV